jgi:hypothetical protein
MLTLSRVVFSFTKDDWCPLDFFTELNKEFYVQLDPYTTEDNPLGTRYFYTKVDNGLSKPWYNSAYVNPPPYGNSVKYWLDGCQRN